MSTGSLLLHPSAVPSGVSAERAIDLLAASGFIADRSDTGPLTFLIGSDFLQLVTFMGCSPYIEFAPPSNGGADYCHVQIHAWESPRLLLGANTRPPRCPACRKPIDAAPAALADRTTGTCPHCGKASAIKDLQWRRDAGFSDFFIEIHSVFPGEAVPTEGLLRRLESLGGNGWKYFYLTGR